MANLNLFTHAANFSHMKPEFLRNWLTPSKEYLAKRGLVVPEPGSDEKIDLTRLAAIFMEPDGGMPRELMHSAALIHEMSNERAMLDLLDVAHKKSIDLEIGEDPDPMDVAVQLWLKKPELLEEMHQMHQLERPRGFTHFVTDRDPLPDFEEPTPNKLTELENDLAEWFYNAKRGRHAKVWMYKRPSEYWFLIRHGLASRRQEIVSATGTDTLIFRPGEYDVLVYNRDRGELRVHGCSPKEVEMFRVVFGKHLFGDTNFFPGGARFTLAPLVEQGRACLACKDVPGMQFVTLTEVQIYSSGGDWLRTVHQSADIFTTIEDERVILPEAEYIVRATFLVRFSDSTKERRIKIMGSNKLSVLRDGDTEIMEKWLNKRGFVLKRHDNEPEPVLAGT